MPPAKMDIAFLTSDGDTSSEGGAPSATHSTTSSCLSSPAPSPQSGMDSLARAAALATLTLSKTAIGSPRGTTSSTVPTPAVPVVAPAHTVVAPISTPLAPVVPGVHECDECGLRFSQKVRFLYHRHTVHNATNHAGRAILPCGKCDSAFLRKTDRTKHISCVHERKRPFKCEVENCKSAFFFSKDLAKHHSTVHQRCKPFACNLCSSKFGKREHMTSHIRRVHEKLKPYACPICKIRLASKYNLQGHLKTASHATAERAALARSPPQG